MVATIWWLSPYAAYLFANYFHPFKWQRGKINVVCFFFFFFKCACCAVSILAGLQKQQTVTEAVSNLNIQTLLWYLYFYSAKPGNAVDVARSKGDAFFLLVLCWGCRNTICSILVASCTYHLWTADDKRRFGSRSQWVNVGSSLSPSVNN